MMNKIILLLAMAFCISGCDKALLGDEEEIISLEENLRIPPDLKDGWEVSSMEAQQISPVFIRELITDLQHDNRNIHSLLIIKNNKLVSESYFAGWQRERLQSIRSASKSVTSALIGIAIDQHHITDVDQRIFDFFPEYADLKTDKKNEIRLRHVLSMSSGLQWDQESFASDDSRNDESQLEKSKDGLRYVLQKPVIDDPGIRFNYSSGNSDLLTGIIHHTTGKNADIFAEEYLFKPLGITTYGWRKQQNGYNNAGYGLFLRPRDMAKIGQLFLDNGQWKGKQVISSQWVALSTSKHINTGFTGSGYGFQWWTRDWMINGTTVSSFQAQGKGGQVICVVPALKAVIVLTGGNYDPPESDLPYNFLKGTILPALL